MQFDKNEHLFFLLFRLNELCKTSAAWDVGNVVWNKAVLCVKTSVRHDPNCRCALDFFARGMCHASPHKVPRRVECAECVWRRPVLC